MHGTSECKGEEEGSHTPPHSGAHVYPPPVNILPPLAIGGTRQRGGVGRSGDGGGASATISGRGDGSGGSGSRGGGEWVVGPLASGYRRLHSLHTFKPI